MSTVRGMSSTSRKMTSHLTMDFTSKRGARTGKCVTSAILGRQDSTTDSRLRLGLGGSLTFLAYGQLNQHFGLRVAANAQAGRRPKNRSTWDLCSGLTNSHPRHPT